MLRGPSMAKVGHNCIPRPECVFSRLFIQRLCRHHEVADRLRIGCYIAMISRIIWVEADSVVSDTNGFISFAFSSWLQIIMAYANHTILTLPHARRILGLRSQLIYVGQDPNSFDPIKSENLTTRFNGRTPTLRLFEIVKFSGPFFSGYNVFPPFDSLQRPSSSISCLGVYYDRWWLSYPFRVGVWVPRLTASCS